MKTLRAFLQNILDGEGEACLFAARIFSRLLRIPNSHVFDVFLFRSLLGLMRNWRNKKLDEKQGLAVADEVTKLFECGVLKKHANGDFLPIVCEALAEVTRAKQTETKPATYAPIARWLYVRALTSACRIRRSKSDNGETAERQITAQGFKIFGLLLTSRFASRKEVINEIYKCLLPNIVMSFGMPLSTVPEFMRETREMALSFVEQLLKSSTDLECDVSATRVLMQHIAVRCPERAEYRNKAAESLARLLSLLPDEHAKFAGFLRSYSRTAKASARQFAIDAACKLLLCESIHTNAESAKVLLDDILLSRCSDKTVAVRSKALSCVSEIVTASSTLPFVLRLLQADLFDCSAAGQGLKARAAVMLRIADEKASVRKTALQLMESLARCSGAALSNEEIAAFVSAASDASLSVRKQATASITNLQGAFPDSAALARGWANTAFPLVFDPETSVQEAAQKSIMQAILVRLVNKDEGVWIVVEQLHAELERCLSAAIFAFHRQKELSREMVAALQRHIEKLPTTSKSAWLLLSVLSAHCGAWLDRKFVLTSWNNAKNTLDRNDDDSISLYALILTVLANVSHRFKPDQASAIADDIFNRLKQFTYPPPVIHAFVEALLQLKRVLGTDKQPVGMSAWASELLKMCDEKLSSVVLAGNGSLSSDKLTSYLFTIGEVSQGFPESVSKRLITVVQSLVVPESESLHAQKKFSLTPPVRAHALLALGKMCLENETLTRDCIAAFAQELEESDSPVIRNNVVAIMCDLCLRFTSLVQRYIPTVAQCLRDPNELVKRQTIALLSRLLQEGYIKWKGSLFFRFVTGLLDVSPAIRLATEYYLGALLAQSKSNLYAQHFVELIFVLNDASFDAFNKFSASERERRLFSFAGRVNAEKRMQLYKFFLAQMNELQKFQMTGKLYEDVLGPAADGKLCADKAAGVLADVLRLLASEEIKINASTNANAAKQDDIDELPSQAAPTAATAATATADAAKSKLLSKIVRKNAVENIIPVIIELKHTLERSHSPLLGDLMVCLNELMKDYKEEVDEILLADRQLAKEIEYDMKQFKKQSERETYVKAGAQSPVACSSPLPGSPYAGAQSPQDYKVPKLRRIISPNKAMAPPAAPARRLHKRLVNKNVDYQEPGSPAPNVASKVRDAPMLLSPLPTSMALRVQSNEKLQVDYTADIVMPSPLRELPMPKFNVNLETVEANESKGNENTAQEKPVELKGATRKRRNAAAVPAPKRKTSEK
jgi:condensin-2 complex subunit D3